MKPLIISLLFLTGCSTCNFVFDMWANAKGHCFARENAVKLCADKGGLKRDFYVSSIRFICADGSMYEGYKNDWKQVEKFE